MSPALLRLITISTQTYTHAHTHIHMQGQSPIDRSYIYTTVNMPGPSFDVISPDHCMVFLEWEVS